MTVLLADVMSGALSGLTNPNITDDFENYAVAYFPYLQADIGSAGGVALPSTHYPVSASPRVIPADAVPSYFDDFYNRIHTIPVEVALGNILSDKELPISLWNAYLADKSLTAAGTPELTGTALIPPVDVVIPYTMLPLKEIIFTLHANKVGAPIIDDAITFTVDGVDYDTPLTGRRLVLFPFPPNWSSPLDETFTFNSWVLTAADGSEQSGSNWGNQPRRSFEYAAQVRGAQMQQLENLIFGWQHRLYGVPHWAEKSKLTADVVAGASIVSLDTSDRSFEVGGNAVIFKDAEHFEAFSIKTMTTTSLEANTPFSDAWPAGTRVYPISAALLAANTNGTHQTDDKILLPVSFDCEPSASPTNTPIGGATPTYRGEELYLGRLDWASPLSFTQDAAVTLLDRKTGMFKPYSLQGFSKQTRKHNWQSRNRAEGRDLRAWLGRREGVARPVYMSTGKSDFTLLSVILPAAESVIVEDNGYADYVGASAGARRDIIIHVRDGSYIARRIVSASKLLDGSVSLGIDAPITSRVEIADVKRISYLSLYRLTNNAFSIRWITDEVGTAEAMLITKVAP